MTRIATRWTTAMLCVALVAGLLLVGSCGKKDQSGQTGWANRKGDRRSGITDPGQHCLCIRQHSL